MKCPEWAKYWPVDNVQSCLPLGTPFDFRTQAEERTAKRRSICEDLAIAPAGTTLDSVWDKLREESQTGIVEAYNELYEPAQEESEEDEEEDD